MISETITNIKDFACEVGEFIVEFPLRFLVILVFATLFILGACDVWEGEWVSHGGRVVAHRWDMEDVCDEEDKDGKCIRSHTETNYYLTVSHHGLLDETEVSWWDYNKYSKGQSVQVSYREGGVFGIRWFISVSDPKPDF